MLPFIDLEAQQKRIRPELEKRLIAVLDHGHYINGPEVGELEAALCQFCGAKFCIACSSGTDAILMALMALGAQNGDTVYTTAFTFFATAEMPLLLGCKVVFVDIDPVTFNISPADLEKKLASSDGKGKKFLIPVDLFGQPADYTAILPVTRKYGLVTIEDAAQAFGATQNGREVCNLGCDTATTSFFPAKPLGCYGDGGAVFTNQEEIARLLRSLRIHGKGADKYDNERIGINGRIDTMQAAILLAKLAIFPQELEARQKVAEIYQAELADVPDLVAPTLAKGNTSSWAQFCILVPAERRDSIRARLTEHGIPTNVYYPTPTSELRAVKARQITACATPVADSVSQRIIALPFHPYLEPDTIRFITGTIRQIMTV